MSPLSLKGMVYNNCVRICMEHGSETWPAAKERNTKLALLEVGRDETV